ncbi:MAG: GINS complex subunit Sld5 [Desulfurococcaceae archaeon]
MNGLIELLGGILEKFVKRDFEEEPIKVVITSSGVTLFLEDNYIELVRGSEYILPRWIAYMLQDMKLASISDEEIDVSTMNRLAFIEMRNRSPPKFEKLKGYFYNKAKLRMKIMLRDYSKANDIKKLQEIAENLHGIMSSTVSLAKTRISKLLSMLSIQAVSQDIIDNLSEEEKLFYNSMKTLLEVFSKNIFEVETSGGG